MIGVIRYKYCREVSPEIVVRGISVRKFMLKELNKSVVKNASLH